MSQHNVILQQTLNKTDNEIKISTITLLNQFVVDLADLALITKQAHWNMKGSNFIAVHEMLDDFRNSILEHQDTFAERIVQLGGIAQATLQTVVKNTRLEPYPTTIKTVQEHLRALSIRYGYIANAIRQAADECKDTNSADMLTAASRDFDKYLWFIESNLE